MVCLAVLVYFLIVYFVGIPCLFHQLTGLHCPGCGGTRAVRCLIQADFLGAVRQNAWIVLLVVPWLGLLGMSKVFPKSVATKKWESGLKILTRLTAFSAVVFFVVRNIPLPIFDSLRPY